MQLFFLFVWSRGSKNVSKRNNLVLCLYEHERGRDKTKMIEIGGFFVGRGECAMRDRL